MKTIPIAQAAHALFSASGAPAWMRCAPKLAVERGLPSSNSEYADEGTAAHQLGGWCLEAGDNAADYHGLVLEIVNGVYRAPDSTVPVPKDATRRSFTVDDAMAEHVQSYVDKVRDRITGFKMRGAVGVEMMVEVRVDYSAYIDQPNSFGTSDVILLIEWPNDIWQIDVGDLKFGQGVQVYAAEHVIGADGQTVVSGNEQMMMYALGALDQFAALGNYTLFSMAIYQPRIYHFDEYECDLATLLAFGERAKKGATAASYWLALDNRDFPVEAFTPGEKQCRFCKVGGSCRARAQKNLSAIAGDFVDLDGQAHDGVPVTKAVITEAVGEGKKALVQAPAPLLDALYPSLDEIDNWVKAVRGEIERRALAGEVFTTCKLATGKKGNRAFRDEAEAEKIMKSFRLKVDEMYTYKLISPTAAEKLLKDQPKRWDKLLPLIGQADGKLSVVDINDKRPAVVITPAADSFEDLDAAVDTGEFA